VPDAQAAETPAAVAHWLARDAARCAGPAALLTELAGRLRAERVGLAAAWLSVRTLNPLVAGAELAWRPDAPQATESLAFHPPVALGFGVRGPAPAEPHAAALARAAAEDAPAPFAAEDGAGLALPVVLSDGARHAVAFLMDTATLDEAVSARLADVAARLAPPLEVLVLRDTLATLLETYLGRRPARRVLAGEIRRGSAETVEAVLWISDLRGFTALAERLDRDAAVALLNAHFERLAAPIKAFGGEVLKFVGDGLVAIFPTEPDGAPRACARALDAVAAARKATAAFNAGDRGGLPALDFGVGLHRGPVAYGNIGAPDRLDFTVIGPTVNRAARVESRCKPLGRSVLATGAVAEHVGDRLVPVGRHALPGVADPVALFTLAPEAAPPPSG